MTKRLLQGVLCMLLLAGGSVCAQTYVTLHLTDGNTRTYALETTGVLDMTVEGIVSISESRISGVIASHNTDDIQKMTFSRYGVGIDATATTTSVNIHPNPAYDHVAVTGLPAGLHEARIYSSNGKLLGTTVLTDGGELTLGGYNRGIYLLRIGEQCVKIVKL